MRLFSKLAVSVLEQRKLRRTDNCTRNGTSVVLVAETIFPGKIPRTQTKKSGTFVDNTHEEVYLTNQKINVDRSRT